MRPPSRLSRLLRWLAMSLAGAALWGGLALGALLGWAFLIEPYRIQVEQAGVEVDGWPGGGGGDLRIAFLSDLDLSGPPGRRERKALALVRELAPDLVAFGGDLFSGGRDTPEPEVLEAVGAWLGEVADAARHGVALVWGEQDAHFSAAIVGVLPPNVRVVEREQFVIPAGEARVRITGPDSHFCPVGPRDGSLRGREGLTVTVVPYRGEDSQGWTSLEMTARLRFGAPGDGPGLAVLLGPDEPGLHLRISPETAEWRAMIANTRWHGRRRQAGGLPSQAWIRVRIQVEVADGATMVRSRAWPEGREEPGSWTVRVSREDEGRPTAGTVGVVLGGPWRGSGYHEWDDLVVRGGDGTELLREAFDDPAGFAASWRPPCGPAASFDATVQLLHSSAPLVGLGRQPFLDLVLAGHTQGGLVRIPPFAPMVLDPNLPAAWTSGLVRLDHGRRWLYVTRGIGTPAVRLFCPPEVTDFTLRVTPRPEP